MDDSSILSAAVGLVEQLNKLTDSNVSCEGSLNGGGY